MGDDLIAARRFCVDADQHLAYLSSEAVTPRQSLERLGQIEKSADHVKANAIVREIRQCRSSLHLKNTSADNFKPWLTDTLYGLTHLIRQYRQGLCEITPKVTTAKEAQATEAVVSETPLKKIKIKASENPKTPVTVLSAIKADANSPAAESYLETHRKAQDILRPLLKFTDNDRQYSALSKLAAYTANSGTDAQLQTTTGLESQLDIADDIDFTAIIPALSNAALSAARRTGKIVSLSYDCDDVKIPHINRAEIEAVLVTIGESLVEHVLEWPNVRHARGQSGAGHISLSARAVKSVLTLSFECPGTPITDTHFKAKNLSSQNYSITLRPENKGQCLTLTLKKQTGNNIARETMAPKTMERNTHALATEVGRVTYKDIPADPMTAQLEITR